MEARGQKRTDMTDELPADKRACSSLEFRPSSSNSSVQTHLHSPNSTPETREADMDTSSSASASSRSDGEPDRDSPYGSCDSDDADPRHSRLRDLQRRRSSGDHAKLNSILSSLAKEDDPSGQLVALTELCEVLSFCTEDTFSSMLADSFSPLLVKLAKHEHNADIMLLAIRAITYLCDVFPRSSSILVRHEAVPVLCQRLMAVEYLDVAEQCLQALEKLSRDQPLACLQAGAILAVLNFIEFFSTSIQRVALSTVVNICKKLPLENSSLFMEAVPMLCNLLQHEDRQLVERVVLCLLKIVERASESSKMLDELCKNGLIQQVTHLISIKSRTTLSQPIYNGLIRLLVTLTSGSFVAFKALHELHISRILKDVLSSSDLAHGEFSQNMVDGKSNQVSEVLKLLNELIPSSIPDQNIQQLLDKEAFLTSHPDLLEKIGFDMLDNLIQVVDSGANIYVSYGCLSIINKLIHLSNNNVLVSILNTSNIASFLTGVFTRKENHVLMLALQIIETTLQKSSDVFLNSFIKEGVLFALDALLTPRKCSQSMFPVYSGAQIQLDSGARYSGKQVMRCLCYAFDRRGSQLSSETGACKLGKDSVLTCVKHIKSAYFAPELFDTGKGVTDVLQDLRSFSDALNYLIDNPIGDGTGQNEEFFHLLNHILQKLSGREPVSTFEFIESGIVKSLVNYASNGLFLKQCFQTRGLNEQLFILQERFEVLARLFSSSFSDILVSDLPLSLVVQKLHGAFSSVENLPIVLNPTFRERSSYATVPSGCSVMHPCLRVRFSKEKEETSICDSFEGILTVDPFSSVDSIKEYLKHKVVQRIQSTESDSHAQQLEQMQSQLDNLPINTNLCEDSSPAVAIDGPSDLSELQEEEGNFPQSQIISEQEQVADLGWSNSQETALDKSHTDHQRPSDASTNENTDDSAPSSREPSSPKLSLHLDGHQLVGSLTLYQAILEQQLKSQDEMVNPAKLWSRVYTITYKHAVDSEDSDSEMPFCFSVSSVHDKGQAYTECTSFFSRICSGELASYLDKSSPTYDVLFLLKSLEALNRYSFHLISRKKLNDFAEGRIDNLDDLKVVTRSVPQSEFVNSKLSQKLEQQMRDPSAVSVGAMPSWCGQLMVSCPFIFSFEIKSDYFRLAAFGPQKNQPHLASRSYSGPPSDRTQIAISLPRKKFLVSRDSILESAARMMELHARNNRVLLEVEYSEEVGTGLGPTLEFYTLVSREFQKPGLAMWREDHGSPSTTGSSSVEDSAASVACFGLFPRPWSTVTDTCDGVLFSEVLEKFVLLGQITARAIQDGRVLDLPFSRAFYKLILDQELTLYDIQLFDPALGRTLLEFQALAAKRRHLNEKIGEDLASTLKSQYRNTNIDDLCLEFTLPGYHYVLTPDHGQTMVNMENLEEYVKLVVDATIRNGISRQLEAFKFGFNQVFPIKHLRIFSEDELERLICGEHEFWMCNELLDHIKFDHGYTASSPPVVNLLEILQEFNHEERRAFLQFVTGAPHLPPGGLSSLNPKLTIVRKHTTSGSADGDLPSVMTCANYLKLPAYSSKERMREKLSYAIREGQGSFHLS